MDVVASAYEPERLGSARKVSQSRLWRPFVLQTGPLVLRSHFPACSATEQYTLGRRNPTYTRLQIDHANVSHCIVASHDRSDAFRNRDRCYILQNTV